MNPPTSAAPPANGQTGTRANRKQIALLGSTGSIGRQALDVVRAHPERFEVVGLAAGRNVELLVEQTMEFRPAMVACMAPEALRGRFEGDYRPAVVSLREMATDPVVDIVLSGLVGKDGLAPALAALEAGKVVALAN